MSRISKVSGFRKGQEAFRKRPALLFEPRYGFSNRLCSNGGLPVEESIKIDSRASLLTRSHIHPLLPDRAHSVIEKGQGSYGQTGPRQTLLVNSVFYLSPVILSF
jgi:hypothetical protein